MDLYLCGFCTCMQKLEEGKPAFCSYQYMPCKDVMKCNPKWRNKNE